MTVPNRGSQGKESEGRCAESKALRTGKRKRDVPEDMRDQTCQEGARRGEAITRASKGTDTEVGMMVCSTPREHEKQRKGGKRAKRSSEDRSTSTHSESKIDIRGKPTEGKPGKGKVGTRRRAERGDGRTEGGTHAARVRRNSRCVRSDRGLDRGTYAAEREGRYEHRIWWIGWKDWIYSE